MASTISFSGLSASGLDTSSWVDALVSVKQQTITSLEQQKAEKENLLSIVNNIKSYFSSFQTCLQKITDSQYGIASMDLFMQNLALSSNSSIATATATTEAARQSYDVAVDSLATATKATSGYSQFEVKTADLNTTFGTLGGKNGTITVNSQSFNVTTEDTLQNLIDKFKNVGVDAKFDESKGTFTIGMDLNKIDEGATNLKNALKLANNNVSGAVSGSVVYANRNTEFYKLGLNGGAINIEGVKHTITKNGNNYTIQKDGGAAVQMNTLGEFLDYLKSSAVGADDATVDAKGHITIKGATLDKVEGGTNLIDVLNLIESQKRTVSESGALSYIEVRVADLNTKLSALGITGDTTLVAGGTNNTISNDKTLGDIKNILKNAGVDMSVDSRGIITIDTHGNEISGTLLDVLNLDPTKGGTTISSSAHQATLKADGNTKLSELGITTDKKYIAYKSDGTALTTEISNVEGKTVNEFVNALKNSGLDAKFDEKTHQITIKDGYIEGSLADALGMTQLSTSFTENASLNTQLEKLGATGDSTLTIDGGAAKTYDKNTTLETVFNDIKNAGGKVTFKDGNVTIEGVTLGGSLPSLLGLDATTQGTSVTSGKLTAVTGSTSSGGNTESTVEHNIELSTKLGDITGTTSNYTLKVGDGTSTTYTKDSTLQDIKTQIEGAGGKFTINDDNTISIEGVTMSGTVVGALGFDELATGTKFTTVDAVMISGTSNVATGGTTLGNLGLISGSTSGARAVRRAPANPNKTLSINGGTAKTYGADSSLDDIFADIVAAGGTASINSEGYIVINGVHLEGTLVDALGLVETSYKTTITSGDLKVTTSTKSTSSSTLYTDTKGDIAWDSTIGSIVGDTNSYDLKVNGTNKTYNTNTKLSDIKNVIQAAGGTMTINDDNTISINGVEISGSLVDKLGFNSDGVHTVVSSNNPIYYTDGKKSADTGTTFEQLGIGTDKRDYAIYKNDGTVVKASSTNGTSSGKTIGDWLRVVNDSLNTANGTRDITYASINNGVISITGGYVTGSLPTELGIGIKETVTGITMEGSSVSYVEYEPLKYIGNIQTGSGIAGGTMVSSGFMAESIQYQDELGNIHAVTETTKLSEVLDTSGNKIGSGSYTFNVGSYTKTFDADSTTLGDIVNYVNNLNMDTTHDTITSATLVDGKLTIESNVSITGTLLDKLGFEKQDVSTVAYEIKGTNKAHYSSVDSTTYTASGFTKATETKTGNVTTVSLELPSGFATSLNIVDTSDAISLSSISSISGLTNGTKYTISTKDDLVKLAEFSQSWSKYTTNNITFILANDIDMSGVTDFAGIANFYGIFSGNGHVIKNVTINGSLTVGLFKQSEGTIQDLGLENANVTHAENTTNTRYYVGALVGQNNGNIRNCYVNNSTVTAKSGVQYAGGLVGCNEGKVTYSWTNVNVQRANTRTYMGGFVGENMDYSGTSGTIISNCFSVSNLQSGTTQSFSGGMYGSTVSNCFSVGVNGGVCGSTATVIEYSHYSNAYADDNEKITSGSLVSLKSKIDALGFDNLNWNVEEKELRVSEADSFEVGMTYHISTVADLQKLSSYSNTRNSSGINGIDKGVNFVLDNDIDMSSVSNFVGIANFKGNFYGNGHVIKNLKISKSGKSGYAGLFATIAGTVQDLGLENVNITTSHSYGLTPYDMYAGALAGSVSFNGKVTNCYVSGGTISGNATIVGGLIGQISENDEYSTQLVSDCWANVTVNKTSYSKDGSYNTGAVGGLVGSSGGTISNCYSLGDVNAAYGYVGGFVGVATGTISNSFSTGNVKVTNSSSSNTTYTGGFAGALGSTGTMGFNIGNTVNMQNNYSTGTVTAAKGSVGGFTGGAMIDVNQGTKISDYTMSNNFSDSGSASKAIGSGSVSGISAVANSEINSGISGLGFSNLTMTEVVNEHTATTSTTIKDLMGKGGSQTLTLTPTAGGSAVTLTFNETDTIQTVIDKLKAQGIDEADLTDGIFRIKDDKQWTLNGSSELVNKLFGGDDRTYSAEGPQVTYQVTQSSVGGYTGNKITYTTTTTGTVGSVTGSQLSYTTSGTGTAGSVTGNKVTYETTGTGTAGSVTGDKLTYTVSTADGSIVSNEMLYKKLANNSMSISGNKVTYTGTGTGSGSSGFVLSPDMTDDPSRWQVVLGNGINGNSTLSEILKKNDYIFEDYEADDLLSKDGIAIDGLTADMTLNQLCEKLGWEYSNHTLTAISNTKTDYSGIIIDALFQGGISINPEDTVTKTYLSSVSGNLSIGKAYWIKSVEDLQKLATYSQNNDTSRLYFVLDNDIDMSGVNFDGISNFQGEFHGQGHTISNLTTSLFTSVSGANALVKDIGLLNSDVTAIGDVKGLLADSVSDGATIMNCYVTGGLFANGCTVVGGLVGKITDNALISCSSANVTISGLSHYHSGGVIGGLVGEASGNAQIRYSHSSGRIEDSSGYVAGGFVGHLKGSVTISNGYTTVDLANRDYGAFAGYICEQVGSGGVEQIGFSGTLSNVFATADTQFATRMGFEDSAKIENVIYNSAANTSTSQPALFTNNATGLTLAQMQDGSTMQNYGFTLENLWNTSNGIPDFTDPTASSSKIVATGSTTMAQLGITDFTINGDALSGINADSTVVEVFTALKNEYGIEASISNGTVTFSATSDNYLEGEIINKFFGSKAVEFSTGLNGNSIKSNKVQYSTIETTYRDVYNQFDILPESTNSTKIFDLYVQSMASPSGKKISSGSITVGSVTFTIDSSTTVADLKRFLKREDCTLDSIDGAGTSLYNIVSNNGASVSVSGDIANDVGGSFIGSLCTKSTVSAEETVNHNIDNNTTIGQIFGDTASHTIKVGDETVTLQSTDKLSTLVSKLADKGVTAEIKNSALYLTTSNSTVFSGDIISRFFGQDKVIAGGSTYKYVDIELSTKFSDMEYASTPVFEVDGTQIDGLTKDSTIQDLFNKLASKGINASLSNGKITLTSDTEHTLTGTAVEDFFGGAVTVGSSGGATSKTYSGSVLKTVSKGYSTDTKLVDIDSSYKGTKMYVYKENSSTSGTGTTPVRPGTSGTPGKPGNSVDMNENNLKPVYEQVAALSIDSNTTIQDVIDFYRPYLDAKDNVFKPLNKYSLEDGTITLAFKSGYSDKSFGSSDETTLSFGTTTPTVATTSTKLYELETSPAIISSIKVTNNGNKYSFDAGSDGTDSPTIQDVLDFLNNTAGCTATFTDGKLTVTGASDLEFEKPTTTGKIYDMSVLFGGSMPTPTTSGGSGSTGGSSTQTATGTTKMSELGITDFKVNGSALSGITGDSTVDDVLAKLKSTYGLSDATISDGKITLSSNSNTTLSGNLIKGLMGQDSVTITPTSGTTTTTKTYTGTKVTYGATPATGYATNTKLSTIKSHWVGQRIYVKSSEYTGSTTGYPGNSLLFQYMDITNKTTIDDVINFFDRSAGVSKATYDQTSGELELQLNADYSVSAPFICTNDTIGSLRSTVIYAFGKTGGSRGSNMTASTTLADLNCLTAKDSKTLTVTNNGTTTSFDVSQETNLSAIISNLQSAGCTASITGGVLTVTGGEDLAFGGNTTVWKKIFGGSIPTPTTSTTGSTGGGSTGGTSTVTATGSTKMSELGITDFTVNDSVLSGITSSSTVNDVLAKLKLTYGLSEATISDGKITLKSTTVTTLSGNLIKGLMGQDFVTIIPTVGDSTTNTATEDTTFIDLGYSNGSCPEFKVDGMQISITSTMTIKTFLAILEHDYGITGSITDGKITLSSDTQHTLTGEAVNKLFGQDSVTITPTSGGSSINTATEDTTFIDLGYSNGSCPEFKVDGSQITITSSNTIKNLLTLLERDYGITGSITDGKITLSSDTQHTLTGEAVNKLFGQDSVTISPDTTTTTLTADTTTKLGASGLGLTSFDLTIEPTGDATSISISGLNGDSTIGDVFKKLAEKGITASMNNGVITLTSNTPCDLTGTIAKKLFGKDSVSLECADEIHDFTMTQVSGTKYQYVSRDLTSYSGAERVSEVSELVAGNKYHISSAEDLVALANFVKNGADTTGSIFMFDNDIDMSGVTGFEGIGTRTNAFKGTVYGNGHVVKNMTINTSSSYQGLFGNINQSTIKDLGVVDANVTGDSYIGILVGQAENSQISNVYTSGTVTSNDAFVGGLVGDLTDSTATNVYSTADVKGSAAVGGLIGFSDGSIVEKAFATGKVTATDGQVGGLIGAMSNGGTVKNSYATGDVNGKVDVGGFVGVISVGSITTTFDTVYSTSRVSGSQYVGGFIGFVDTDVTTNIKNAVYNRSTGVDAIGGGSATGILGKDYEQMIQKSIMQNAGFTEDKGWVYTANTTPTFGNTTVTGGGKTYLDSSITSLSSGSTYYISTLEQLNNLATLVNNGADTSGVNFVLDNDIDVSSFTNTISDFKGTFYGNGHSLTGLKKALFDEVIGNAIVRDLALENMSGVGHLANTVMDNSTVDNVYSTGSTNDNAGLICSLEGNATLKNSYSTANIIVNGAYAGGLVSGMRDNATIEHCFAKNTIEQKFTSMAMGAMAGGLVGIVSGGTIKSSYADCNINVVKYSIHNTVAGGLIGGVSGDVTIENCYATGSRTAVETGMFIGMNNGRVTSIGNVACTGSSISGTPSGFSDGVTFVSNAELNSQAKMEELGFTKDKGWVYYTGKAPMLQGKDTSSAGTTFQMSDTTTLDSICQNRENKTLSVTINGETHSKTFKGSDTVGDVANWLNGIDGVTANISNNKFNISGTSQDFRVDGELADVLFGNNKTTTKQTITENTDSNGLIVGGGQKKIDDNTTVGQLLGVTSGKYVITYTDDSGNLQSGKFSSDEKLSEVLKFLNDNGFQASIVNGVFTATKDGKIATNISGTIGEKLKGENGTVTNTSSGYKTGQLDASSSTKATATTKLADLGIASGSIFIKDNNNNTLGTIQIDNSMTIDDTAQLLANYGFTLGITDGKVTIEGNGTNRIADGTSNLVSQMKLNNWIETKDKLKTDSTVAQMGFGKGSTLGLVLDKKTYNLTFDANATLQDIIDTLGTYGVTASVDSDGKFTATASGNLVLTNELGAYLTKNSAEGYVKEADGYKSKDPLEFKGDKVKLDYDSKVGDILGTGKDGVLRLTLNKDTVVDLTYKADDTMADIIADLKGYGITATIDDGVLKATSNEKTFRFSGEIGKIISGDTPQYDDISTGYVSKDLSYETTNKTNMNNTLKEMGVSSGQIHVLSNDGKIVSTLDIDNSYTVAQVKSLLQPFGMTLSVDENGKFTVASAEGYKLSDSTSNMVSKMGLNNWTTATEKLSGATTLAQMGFKDGADLNLFLDGIVMNVLSFDANQTVDDIIFGLAAYGIDASVNADGQFTATSKTHTFIMSGGLGSYLTKGTGGYVNSDTAYESYKPLVESKDYVETASKNLDYNKLMTENSTLESLGFSQGGTVRVMLDGKTPYTLQFLATDKVQDVIYALSAYGINAEVKDGRFVAESVNNTFTLTGNLGSYLVQGGAYQNEITGYESNPLTYETTEKLTNDTKLSDLGITRGDINVIKDGKVTDTIHISDNTTIGQLFSAIKPYGMTGEIVTKANGDTSIRISADSDIKLADGTSNVVSGLGLQEVRKGDFEGIKKYWDDDATSGLITEDTLLSTLDRNGFIAQGSLIFNTGEGDDAVQHIINISANETVGSLLKKFNDSGIKATLDDGVIKLTGGLDKLEFTGGTSGLVETIGLDIHNIDKYASSTSALTYEGETHYSASNFANANTKLDIVNATDGNMSIFVDGIKCNIEVKSSDSFADLFKKIKDKVKARTGLDIQAGFKTKDGSISANPNDADNTGIIGLEIEKGHELVVGASNDTTNFATIANLNKTDYNAVTGSRALYRVNVNSLITESGLYRDGDITEGTFKIGDAEFTIDSTTTLASLINQINKNDKAYANAYWDTLAGTLVIESTVTGASLINIEAGTSNFTDIMGFTKTKDGVSALVTDSQTLGQNAVVRINGTTVTSATNVITSDISKIKGLTINLKNVSAGETVTISVEQDKEAIYSAVSDTLDAYNSMMEALGKELADKNSLGGESILKLMRNNLKRLMTSSLTGAYVFKNLASVGISTGEASDKISTNVTSLLIDKDKFMDALNTDSDAVQDLLVGTKANPGIFLQANNIVESSINTEGYFSNMANTLSKSISNIEKKISKNNLAIENYRTKLETKFHNMELTISGLQSAYANILK